MQSDADGGGGQHPEEVNTFTTRRTGLGLDVHERTRIAVFSLAVTFDEHLQAYAQHIQSVAWTT